MYGKATLATLVSRTSINAAIDTVAAIAQGFTLGRQTACSEGRVSAVALIASTLSLRHSYPAEARGPDFRPAPERSLPVPAERFSRSAGCVFGRQQAEDGPRCSRNAIDMTAVRAAVRIEFNLRFLAHAHVFELGLFEIRGDPHLIQGNHSEHLLSGIDVQSDDDLFRDLTGDRRKYFGVSQIQLRLFDSSSFLVYIRHGRKSFGA